MLLLPPPLPPIYPLPYLPNQQQVKYSYVNLSAEDSLARVITLSDRKMEVQDVSESIKRLSRRGGPNQPFQNQPFPSSTQSSPYLLWLQTALLPNPFNSWEPSSCFINLVLSRGSCFGFKTSPRASKVNTALFRAFNEVWALIMVCAHRKMSISLKLTKGWWISLR